MSDSLHPVVNLGTLLPDEAKLFSKEQLDEYFRLEELGHSEEILELFFRVKSKGHLKDMAKIQPDKIQNMINLRVINQLYPPHSKTRPSGLDFKKIKSMDLETLESIATLGDRLIVNPHSNEAEKCGRVDFYLILKDYYGDEKKLGKEYFRAQLEFINQAAKDNYEEVIRMLSADNHECPHTSIYPAAIEAAAENSSENVIKILLADGNIIAKIDKDRMNKCFHAAVAGRNPECVIEFLSNKDAMSNISYTTILGKFFEVLSSAHPRRWELRRMLGKKALGL